MKKHICLFLAILVIMNIAVTALADDGSIVCPSCNSELPDGSKYCCYCGAQVVLTCPSCKAELPKGSKFCCYCGASLSQNDSMSEQEDSSVNKTLYYDELPELPKMDSVVDAVYKSCTTTSANCTKYTYSISKDELKNYFKVLKSESFSIEASKNSEYTYDIVLEKRIVAHISTTKDTKVYLYIEPEQSGVGSDDNAEVLRVGQTISTEEYSLKINKIEFTYELKPSNTSSVYMSYTPDQGKVYIHIDGTFTNNSKKDYCIRDLPVFSVDYDDGYIYTGFAIVDNGDNSFDWAKSYVICNPLASCHYHCLIECPKVIDGTTNSLFTAVTLPNGKTYKYDFNKAGDTPTIPEDAIKIYNSYNIGTGEIIGFFEADGENCTFTIAINNLPGEKTYSVTLHSYDVGTAFESRNIPSSDFPYTFSVDKSTLLSSQKSWQLWIGTMNKDNSSNSFKTAMIYHSDIEDIFK